MFLIFEGYHDQQEYFSTKTLVFRKELIMISSQITVYAKILYDIGRHADKMGQKSVFIVWCVRSLLSMFLSSVCRMISSDTFLRPFEASSSPEMHSRLSSFYRF